LPSAATAQREPTKTLKVDSPNRMKHLNIYNHRRPAQETKLCYETTSDERGRTNSWKESTNANCLANASQGEMEMMNNENLARRIQSQRPKTRKNLFKSPNCPLFRTCIEGENDAVHSLDLMVVVVSTTGTAGTTVSPVRPDLSIDLLRSRSERLLSRLAKR